MQTRRSLLSRKRRPGAWRLLAGLAVACLGTVALSVGAVAPEPKKPAARKPAGPVVPPGVKLTPDLVFCGLEGCNLKLNVAAPAKGEGPFPTVILIHGGGWLTGNPRDLIPMSLRLAQKGYVAVSVGYRLARPFPAAVHDVKCAVRWLRANAVAHRIDKERIGVVGFSSGGHLACMLGLTGGIAALEGNGGAAKESSGVSCVVCCAGLSDLEPLHASCVKGERKLEGLFLKLALETFAGGPPAKAGDRYAKASPISYASKSAPPTLLIHGTEDSLIPIDQSQRLEKKLREAGADVSLMPLKGAAHDFAGNHGDRVEAAALEFLNRHLRQPVAKRP